MEQEKEVKTYFEVKAKEFDDIYEDSGSLITRIANRLFRKGMKQRFNITLNLCNSDKNKSVLDIGCGAGRFTIPLAERGMRVLGTDYSKDMIILAKELLRKHIIKTGKKINLEYECSDFIKEFDQKRKFEIVLAIGVFDYLNDPLTFLKKMNDVAKKRLIISFPKKFTIQMPIRKIWLMTRNCPVYFYSKKDIKELCFNAHINKYKIINHAAGYILGADLN